MAAKIQDVALQLEQLRSDMAQLGETVKALAASQASTTASRLQDAASEKISQAKAASQDLYQGATKSVNDATDKLEDRVRQNPLGAVAVAAGVGFLLGLLNGR